MNIGFIGGGNMATALISGFILSKTVKPEEIFVYDVAEEVLKILSDKFGITPSSSVPELEDKADILIFAVKPNVMPIVLKQINGFKNKLYISIAAGITLDTLTRALGSDKKIVRVMPNTPALVGCGMSVVCVKENIGLIGSDEIEIIDKLFKSVGDTVWLDEKHMNAAIALHSSSPAYIYMLIDAMADSGVKYGIPKQLSLKLAAKAVEGSAKMVLSGDKHPQELKDNVCSPGGTTIAAVCELEKTGFRASVQSAIDACIKKADSM